ncbi:MAG: hypothetical protein U9Q77_01130 [Candidatus Marinimicrobia bacterium]|nr:hypothetical protein [Candidatus Neomarinimicrobiota bacterium]
MKMMITDSGLGGLSVCAGLEQAITRDVPDSEIELLYVNATPDDRLGYNSLKTQAERITLFNRFLTASYERFAPDEIAIACNTLSVIYADTEFAKQELVKVRGIVDAGVTQCNTAIERGSDHSLIIFATETTVEADTYSRSINARSAKIVSQSCPGLAHAISNDASGTACRDLLDGYVDQALAHFDHHPVSLHAFLGCTHYGYQTQVFRECFKQRGIQVQILNPNDLLVRQLLTESLPRQTGPAETLTIKFISRYQIPPVEIESMKAYLKNTAPLTFTALLDQEVIPELFGASWNF